MVTKPHYYEWGGMLIETVKTIEEISNQIMLEECEIIAEKIKLNINNIIENRKDEEDIYFIGYNIHAEKRKKYRVSLSTICSQ